MAERTNSFQEEKTERLKSSDLSIKGSIDSRIIDLVNCLNDLDEYYTTSSCSGRTVVFTNYAGSKTKGCEWLFTSHDLVQHDEVIKSIKGCEGNSVFKFEPCILHIRCQSLPHAQKLHAICVENGFRNSGLTVSKAGRITLAVRSTLGLEVPLSNEGNIMVSDEYIKFIVKKANDKMLQNWSKTDSLYQSLRCKLFVPVEVHSDKEASEQ